MKTSLAAAAFVALALAGLSAQTQSTAPASTPPADKDKDKSVPLVVTGCVGSPEPGTFTVEDTKKGRFQLTGRSLDIYIGKRVEVRGRSESGLHITTGLSPSPNGSAQAILDPVRAAQASLPGGVNRAPVDAPLPKITVTQVKTVKGDCK
jgi:hypothetical protein